MTIVITHQPAYATHTYTFTYSYTYTSGIMKYTLVISLVAAAMAAPTDVDTRDIFDDVKDKADGGFKDVESEVGKITAHLCPTIANCVVALAPTVVACGAAAAEVGANPLADAGCIVAAINAGVNPVRTRFHTSQLTYSPPRAADASSR